MCHLEAKISTFKVSASILLLLGFVPNSKSSIQFFSRIVGKGIPSEHYQIKNVPKRHSKSFNRSLKLNDSGSSRGFSNPSSAISDISTVTLTEESELVPEELEEEIIG